MSVGCVIPAAGKGERMGGGTPKALRGLAGTTLLEHAVRGVAANRSVSHVVVAGPAGDVPAIESLLAGLHVAACVDVVAGGDSRTQSVRRAVAALPESCTTILVHDAARPLVPADVIDRVIAAVAAGAPAVVPVVAVVDTIKQVDQAGRVVRTVDRGELRAAQTPQGFTAEVLREMLAAADGEATDDTGLAERLGIPVIVVPGDEEGLKITRPIDLVLAEALVRRRAGRVH